MVSSSASPKTLQAAGRRRRPARSSRASADEPAPVDRLGDDARRRRPARARAGCRRPAAGTGRRSPAPAGSAGSHSTLHPRGEPVAPPRGRRRRPSTASASSAMPPTGVFSSWLTLATKSRRTSSTRRASVRSSTRSSTCATAERRDPRAARRARPRPSGPRASSSSASRITPSRRTCRARSTQLGVRPARASRTSPKAYGGRAGLDHRVGARRGRRRWSAARPARRRRRAAARAARRLGDRRCWALGPAATPATATAPMSEADHAAERRRERRVHDSSGYAARRRVPGTSRPRRAQGARQMFTWGVQDRSRPGCDSARAAHREPPSCRPTDDRRTDRMRDAFHEELDCDRRPAGRDDPPGRVGDEPGHDGPARRRPRTSPRA